ncbi:hypothetical protein GCM10023325_07410 [Sphingomonas lutea]
MPVPVSFGFQLIVALGAVTVIVLPAPTVAPLLDPTVPLNGFASARCGAITPIAMAAVAHDNIRRRRLVMRVLEVRGENALRWVI